jgi:DNA-binding NtrC family response regulator
MVIDDDPLFLESVKNVVGYRSDYSVDVFSNPVDALEAFPTKLYTCVFLNMGVEMMNGLSVMKSMQQSDPYIPVIVVIEGSSLSMAVEALRQGAFDFIEKPMDINRLFIILRHAVEKRAWLEEKFNLNSLLNKQTEIVFKSRNMQEVMHRIRHLAQTDSHILITGEVGTGKKLIARCLHNQGHQNGRPFISVNCASMDTGMLEKEIFGTMNGEERQYGRCPGKLLKAQSGSLFLEEIGFMPPEIQNRLYPLMTHHQSEPEEDTYPPPDIRLIAATSENPEDLVDAKKITEQFYKLISVVHLRIPPLRERKEDILSLASYFLGKYGSDFNKKLEGFNEQARNVLTQYDWPGNVRELKNVIEMIAFFTKNDTIDCEDIHQALDIQDQLNRYESSATTLKEETQHQEKKHILKALDMNDWRILKTAAMLGINRTSLYKKMKKYDIQRINLH